MQYARQLAHEEKAAPVSQRTRAKLFRLIHLTAEESPAFKAHSAVRSEFFATMRDLRNTRSERKAAAKMKELQEQQDAARKAEEQKLSAGAKRKAYKEAIGNRATKEPRKDPIMIGKRAAKK